MNGEELRTYLVALTSSVTIGVIVPLLILAGITAAIWWFLVLVQRRDDFDLAETLRETKDDGTAGKVSQSRLLGFGAFAVSSWGLAVVLFALPQYTVEVFATYLLFWSGQRPALALAEKWNGVVPFAKVPGS